MEVEDIKRLNLKQGDKLVVKVKGYLSNEVVKVISDQIREWAGDMPVWIMDDSTELIVVGKDEG